jgi:hypothetical protein
MSVEMAQDLHDDGVVGDESEDLHLAAAFNAGSSSADHR